MNTLRMTLRSVAIVVALVALGCKRRGPPPAEHPPPAPPQTATELATACDGRPPLHVVPPYVPGSKPVVALLWQDSSGWNALDKASALEAWLTKEPSRINVVACVSTTDLDPRSRDGGRARRA